MKKSLYELICTSRVGDGVLPPEFSLPDEAQDGEDGTAGNDGNAGEDGGNPQEQGMRFADGAMDGITVYHSAPGQLTEDERKELGLLVMMASGGDFDEAEKGFRAFCKEHRAITIIDELQQYIVSHDEEVSYENLYRFAVGLLVESRWRECVKIGLSILEMYDTWENEELAGAIRRIGLSDEFTLFALFNMRRWPAADGETFELAKRVRGWGRIHCVDFMDAEDEEMKEWLFHNGVDNDVMSAYSAWAVYIKADVESILDRENLSYEEVHALLKLTEALLDEGPVSGISNLEDPSDYIEKVMHHARNCDKLTNEDKEIIGYIEDYTSANR